jgi:hypothetical protein
VSGSFTLFEHQDFRGRRLRFEFDDYVEGGLHTLRSTALLRKVSSVRWELPDATVAVLYEHDDGTGRAYCFGPGDGAERSTHDVAFRDCATTWRWTRTTSKRSVVDAFNSIQTVPAVSAFDRGTTTLIGGHLQGVGRLDQRTLAISASGTSHAEVFFVSWPERIGIGEGSIGDTLVVGDAPLDHAGGLQIAEGVLAVGIEDDRAKDRSRVVFLDVGDATSVRTLHHLAINRPAAGQVPKTRRWTAGAVGLARVGARAMVVVGSWDAAELDFYRATRRVLADRGCTFEHVAEWARDDADTSTWVDDNWGKYQSLNLVASKSRLFVVGGNRNDDGEDWIDLYEVDLGQVPSRRLTKVAKRHMTCRDGASFRWSGGIVADGTVLHALATEKDLHDHTSVNIFYGPGGASGDGHRARFVANTRARTLHSLADPCPQVARITLENRLPTNVEFPGYKLCHRCFP